MSGEWSIKVQLEREIGKRKAAAAGKAEDAVTPQQKLVRAAETGRLEAIVAAAQPAEPPKMVTPEEREAELRRTGQWTDEQKPKSEAEAVTPDPPPAPEPGMPTEPTPGTVWAEERIRWRPRGPSGARPTHNPYRCLTEYDALTGEIIGDGYDHGDAEDDTW
jgi:hypothetical protein